ncbi:MAG: hypothetical protein ABIO72_03030 [Patescibacteria group bacterium]
MPERIGETAKTSQKHQQTEDGLKVIVPTKKTRPVVRAKYLVMLPQEVTSKDCNGGCVGNECTTLGCPPSQEKKADHMGGNFGISCSSFKQTIIQHLM